MKQFLYGVLVVIVGVVLGEIAYHAIGMAVVAITS